MTHHDPIANALASAPIIPVVTIGDANDAVPLATALREGGIRSIEITLRNDAGLPAIEAVAKAGLDIMVGAGTITEVSQLRQVYDLGAQFAVSPGTTPALLAAAQKTSLCYLPGVITPSEIIQAVEYGQSLLKFFPAGSFGGTDVLRQYASVFPQVRFCPTGGISPENMANYLALPNVSFVGGSWLTPAIALQQKDWDAITRIARDSLAALSALNN